MKRRITTNPVLNCVSVSDAKTLLIIEGSEDDAFLLSLIEQAESYAQRYMNRPIMAQTYTYYFDGFDTVLRLYTEGVNSVTLKYDDINGSEQTLSADDYYFDQYSYPSLIEFPAGWPLLSGRPNSIRVEVISGYTAPQDVPDGIKTGVLLMVGHLYNNREGSSDRKVNIVPLGISSFLDQYRVFG